MTTQNIGELDIFGVLYRVYRRFFKSCDKNRTEKNGLHLGPDPVANIVPGVRTKKCLL